MSETEPTPESNQEVPQQPAPEVFEEPIRQEPFNEARPSPELRLGKGNCFEVLGLKESAGESEIASKFRNLAMKYHPDHGGNAEDFKRLMDAYQKAKIASVNGLPDGVSPEVVMAAGASVAASGMEGQNISPEARKMAEQIWQSSEKVMAEEITSAKDIQDQGAMRLKEMEVRHEKERQEDKASWDKIMADAEKASQEAAMKAAEEKRKEMEIFSLKDVIIPLAESGLLSQQETNEFLAIGRAIQLTMQGNFQESLKNMMNIIN